MRIELVGLPGAGKSVFAAKLAKSLGTSVTRPKGVQLLSRGLQGILARPRASLALVRLLLRELDPKLRRSLILNALLGAAAKYRSGIVIDQGYAQSAVAALPALKDASRIRAVLEGIGDDVLLVWCEADESVRRSRVKERGWQPRGEFGPDASAAFAEHMHEGYELVKQVAAECIPADRLVTVDTSDSSAFEMVRAKAGARISYPHLARAFLKSFTLFVAYVLSRSIPGQPGVTVLMYHAIDESGWKLSVPPREFERHMKYLARKRLVVPLRDVVGYAAGSKQVVTPAVSVTFDDGYKDLLTTVLPILERHRIPIAVFVPSNLAAPTDPDARPRLNQEELRTLARSPLVTIGSHAVSHRRFTELSPEEIRRECENSSAELTAILGMRPRFLAYPFGARSSEAEGLVKDAGYEAAFGITEGLVRPGDDLYRLKRVQVGRVSFFDFRLRLTAAVEWNRRIVDLIRHG